MKLFVIALSITLLSGCVSYSELSYQCSEGNRQACIDKMNRDSLVGSMAIGLDSIPKSVVTNCTAIANTVTCDSSTQPSY